MTETGMYIRTLRDGKWQNLDIAELTDSELDQLEEQQPFRGWLWTKALARWIRDNVQEVKEGQQT